MVPSLRKTLFLPRSLYLVNSTHFFLSFSSFSFLSFVFPCLSWLFTRSSALASFRSLQTACTKCWYFISWDSNVRIMLRRRRAPAGWRCLLASKQSRGLRENIQWSHKSWNAGLKLLGSLLTWDSTTIPLHLPIRSSGHRRVMWTWYDVFILELLPLTHLQPI